MLALLATARDVKHASFSAGASLATVLRHVNPQPPLPLSKLRNIPTYLEVKYITKIRILVMPLASS
jgi:hypothetical protein